MTGLVRYEAARAALAEARRVDEVKDIRDKAEAVRAYARQAGDLELERDACELRLRADRRMGILLAQMKQTGELLAHRHPQKNRSENEHLSTVTLADLGLERKDSMRAQQIGGLAEQAFEAMVARQRERIAHRGRLARFDLASEDKRDRRQARERALAERQRALPEQKFGVIYADPEWRFEPYSRQSGLDRAADNHYPTSSTAAIAARPIATIAAQDCALFLWATVPMLPDALEVMRAWGFNYRSQCVWIKDRLGTGYWFRNAHELLLLGVQGQIPAPAPGTQWPSAIEAPVGEHSQKPDRFYELIESYFPTLPKIELNARRARPGWSAWGLEAPTDGAGEPLEHDPATGEVTA